MLIKFCVSDYKSPEIKEKMLEKNDFSIGE